jgi:hypothetical protein
MVRRFESGVAVRHFMHNKDRRFAGQIAGANTCIRTIGVAVE